MLVHTMFVCWGAVLMLAGSPLLGWAQTPKASLETYIAQSVAESQSLNSATMAKWALRHPGEVVETPAEKESEYDPRIAYKLTAWEEQARKLQGRWCLRSLAEIELAGGIHVRRIALFYQPLVEQTYGKPMPPLPRETGEALPRHGCRLVRILYEFAGATDPHAAAEAIARQLPGSRAKEPGKLLQYTQNDYWIPICSYEKFGQPVSYSLLFVRDSKLTAAQGPPAVLWEWEEGILDYGEPSTKTIHPLAGQPWLAQRAAKLAGLPEDATIDMLSFLGPQLGDTWEHPPFRCHRQCI